MKQKFEKVGIFGRSQSGKSTLMDRLLRPMQRLILFDSEVDSREVSAKREGLVHIADIDTLQSYIADNYHIGFRIWFEPTSDYVQSLSDLSDVMIDFQKQYKEQYGRENRPALTLAVDEMADCYPNHTLSKSQSGFDTMCRRGRHNGIHLYGASQRLQEVSTKFRGQLDKRFIFSLQEARDLGVIREMFGADGREIAELVRKLPQLEYIKYHNNIYTMGKITFD